MSQQPRRDAQEVLRELAARMPQPQRPLVSPRRRLWRNILLFLSGALIAVGLCTGSVCRICLVDGDAMAPTLCEGDRVLIVRAGGEDGVARRNSLVLFRSPVPVMGSHDLTVKRVVALPGDTIEVREGKLIRSGRVAEEPYLREHMDYVWGPVTCPESHLIVLGDNRNVSRDSHTWRKRGRDGVLEPAPFLPRELVEGVAAMVIFPPGRIGSLSSR